MAEYNCPSTELTDDSVETRIWKTYPTRNKIGTNSLTFMAATSFPGLPQPPLLTSTVPAITKAREENLQNSKVNGRHLGPKHTPSELKH